MGTTQDTKDAILQQLQTLGNTYAKKMFGEYGLYCDDKMVALISDDQLFVKPTEGGKAFLEELEEAPPYPGAKDWFYISEEKWEDADWLCELITITIAEVVPSKKKKK